MQLMHNSKFTTINLQLSTNGVPLQCICGYYLQTKHVKVFLYSWTSAVC